MLLGGFVKVGHMTPALMHRFTSLAMRLPNEAFNARDAVNVVHALSRSCAPVPRPLLHHMCEAALLSRPTYVDKPIGDGALVALPPDGAGVRGDRHAGWSTNTACMMAAALARLGYWHPALFDMLAQVLTFPAAPHASSSSTADHSSSRPAGSPPADPDRARNAPDAVDTLSLLSAAAAFRAGGSSILLSGDEGYCSTDAGGRADLEMSFEVIDGVIRRGILANTRAREVCD